MVPKWLQMLSLSQVQLGGCPGVREAELNRQFIQLLVPSEPHRYCIFVSISRQSHLPRFVRLFLLLIQPLQGISAADVNDYWLCYGYEMMLWILDGASMPPMVALALQQGEHCPCPAAMIERELQL